MWTGTHPPLAGWLVVGGVLAICSGSSGVAGSTVVGALSPVVWCGWCGVAWRRCAIVAATRTSSSGLEDDLGAAVGLLGAGNEW